MTTTSAGAVLVVDPGSGALAVVEQVDRHLPGPGLALVHDAGPERGARARDAAVAHAALGRDDIVVRVVTGPLSRFVLLARVLRAMRAPVGVVAASVEPVLGAVRTSALLASVAHLEDPTPSLVQHARGLAPGGCFLVDGGTVTLVRHRLPRGMGRGAEAVLATGEGQVSDWPDRLWSALGPPAEQPTPLVLPGRSCWGTARWAEISVVAAPTDEMAARLDRTPTRSCSWCARPVAVGHPCPFCGAAS